MVVSNEKRQLKRLVPVSSYLHAKQVLAGNLQQIVLLRTVLCARPKLMFWTLELRTHWHKYGDQACNPSVCAIALGTTIEITKPLHG